MNNRTLEMAQPILLQRADPFMMRHTDGFYYFVATVPAYDLIELRKSKTIQGFSESEGVVVWKEHETGEMKHHIWAPELHRIDGKWYIYFAAAHSDDVWRIRMYCLECESQDPLAGPWVEKGEVKPLWDSFSLDGTTFEHLGKQYYIWAQNDPSLGGNTNLYIDELTNPWTLAGKQVRLTRPELDWECIGFKVNEGPAIVMSEHKIYLTYSASKTDYNYCMGLLEIDKTADLLDSTAWIKHQSPVFVTDEEVGIYGPGHNSFTVSEDGQDVVLVYHARTYKDIEGDPLHDPNRHTFVRVIHVDDSGIKI